MLPLRRLLLCVLLAIITPLGHASDRIVIRGSDTMVLLGQRWAERYMKEHPGVVVQVAAGGSGTGISALLTGSADICFASRPMLRREQEMLERRFGTSGVAIPCALDGVAVYLHPDNPVQSLSIADVGGIFGGFISNWKEVGGRDLPIVLYGREENSGTYQYIRDSVMSGTPYAPHVRLLRGTAAVVAAVAHDSAGIGYGGVAYGRKVREIAIRAEFGAIPVSPSAQTIRDGSYPMSRSLYMYVKAGPEGILREFVDWVLGPEGQGIVEEAGFVPLR